MVSAQKRMKIFKAIKSMGGSAATWNIANIIGMRGETPEVLKTMKDLEFRGYVKRSKRYTTRNNIVWEKSK